MVVRKPFELDRFRKNDEKAKQYAIKMFKDIYGVTAKRNPDQYGVDLLLYDEDDLFAYAECEIKWYLGGGRFIWDTLQILERKTKFIEVKGLPVLFCLFDADGKVCYMTKGEYLKHLTPVEVKNRAVKHGEYFYKVPLVLVRIIDLRGNHG